MEIVVKSPPKRSAGRKKKYPFQELQVGQCLVIKDQSLSDYKRVHSAAYAFRKRENYMHWTLIVRFDGGCISVYRTV